MTDHPTTPPPTLPTRAQVEDALRRLHDATNLAWPREEDVVIVEGEIARLRRHSDAFAKLLRDLAPLQVTPARAGDQDVADLLTGMLEHILTSPEELDLIATAILEAEAREPFLT